MVFAGENNENLNHEMHFIGVAGILDSLGDHQIVEKDEQQMLTGRHVQNRQVLFMGNLFVFGGTGLSGERYCPVRNQWVDLGSYSHLLLNNLNNWAICLSYSSQNSLHLGGPAHLLDDITKYQLLLK